MIETMSRFDPFNTTGHFELNVSPGQHSEMFKCNSNNNHNNNSLVLPSMTISNESKTPYTDATQVRLSSTTTTFHYFDSVKSRLHSAVYCNVKSLLPA